MQNTQEKLDYLSKLAPRDYLMKSGVMGALLPAMDACLFSKPEDPVSFIALYLLRHGKGYSKEAAPIRIEPEDLTGGEETEVQIADTQVAGS